ncbi:uncharacterized protein Z518_10910 [Rhinocladiella mackenziei CBS 650.93]|uniref:HTH myb-type domain-containing protein n=1 Tax=Rhinocladiella mackenziei CBS 650.93 TaxID=1442369 RepID=A0A0D2GNQ7_9EURO|nr:uncharacterized protein Z518_10910 [Rhinocladiella mackenziei CBS 650.93]KIW99982.1 hypothetical protein Z518_10910 [Rhinocladiella mackenziei CBS 650.93]
MSRNSPAQQAEADNAEEPLTQKQKDPTSLPTTSSPLFKKSDTDDNPRSPKRRRISPAGDEHTIEDVNKPTAPQVSSPPQEDGQKDSQPPQSVSLISAPAEDKKDNAATKIPESQSPSRTLLESLPALDNLASQILTFLARLTPTEALGISNTPNSPSTREYVGLRSMFDPKRRPFSTGSPFLSWTDLGLHENSHIDIIRRANQAIFMSSVFTGEIGLRDMDRSFLSVFVPENGKLLKAQASIYLELKTQGFITAWRTGAAQPAVVMADLFGPDLSKHILARRPGTTSLAPSEQDFLNRLSSRREILQAHVKDNTLDQLPLRYRWEDFSREVSSYLSKYIENASNSSSTPMEANRNDPTKCLQRGQMEGQFSIHASPITVSSMESIPVSTSQSKALTDSVPLDDFVVQAARAAEIAMQDTVCLGYSEPFPSLSSPTPSTVQRDTPTPQPTLPDYQHYEPTLENTTSKSPVSGQSSVSDEIPHASQTAPTSVLYERARLAASTKAALTARKGVVPSQRRPWTTEEENALMTGLDRVKGPHWSQILAMYGPGGTVSEALKDRNQVQLKDKARNLKLFFLKSGIEVPYYLKYVTGDLKTRAPGQASKQEAREREMLQLERDGSAFDSPQGSTSLGSADRQADSNASQSNHDSPIGDDSGHASPSTQSKTSFNPSMADVETMIARATAQASRSLGPDWP